MSGHDNPYATFSQEDSDRLLALSKDVQQGLDAMGDILAKAMGKPLENGARVKCLPKDPKLHSIETESAIHLIEILDLPDGSTCCAVWEAPHTAAKLYCPC